MSAEQQPLVTRFEVWDETGRPYTSLGVNVELSYQDDGRTLIAIVKERPARQAAAIREQYRKNLARSLKEASNRAPAIGALLELSRSGQELDPCATAIVCVTHARFIPCRRNDGCVLSSSPEAVEAVRRYQAGL